MVSSPSDNTCRKVAIEENRASGLAFALVLKPAPGCLSPIRSLRALLKHALRVHDLRCVECREVK